MPWRPDLSPNFPTNVRLPLQPVYVDEHGTKRFRENLLVKFLLDEGGITMNALAMRGFPQADYEQFASLIGYSVSGFGDLSYVSDEALAVADADESPLEAANAYLRQQLANIADGLREPVAHLFGLHPDDLKTEGRAFHPPATET